MRKRWEGREGGNKGGREGGREGGKRPVIVTLVPLCPSDGWTSVTSPCTRYVQVTGLTDLIIAIVSAISSMDTCRINRGTGKVQKHCSIYFD